MATTLGERIRRSWNAFIGKDQSGGKRPLEIYEYSGGSSLRPDRPRFTRDNAKSMLTAIYNRIAVDVADIEIKHVYVDENGQYVDTIDSTLNDILSLDANIDQTGRAFIQDVVMSMFDDGCVAIVPTDTTADPNYTDSYDILALRTGRIKEWYPKKVLVNIYNEQTGIREDVMLSKHTIGIIENPFYAIMNEPNSTLQRLIRVLNHIDKTNEQNAAGKLDLIIQLPYLVKSENRKEQAEARRRALEKQMTGSQYGIGYIDGTEKITQLNRSIENNLWQQAKDLQADVYNQLGLTEEIFKGTADEKVTLDYYNRTIEPIVSAISLEMSRKFLSKNARTRGQTIKYFRNPFKLVPINSIAEMADKFTRNEILTSNEIRSIIGFKPSNDARADQLINSNLNHDEMAYGEGEEEPEEPYEEGTEGEEEYYDEE